MNEDPRDEAPKPPTELMRAARLCASAMLIGSGVIGCALAAVAHDSAAKLFRDAYVWAAWLSVATLICGGWLFVGEWRRR